MLVNLWLKCSKALNNSLVTCWMLSLRKNQMNYTVSGYKFELNKVICITKVIH